jgi:hypothetical protein
MKTNPLTISRVSECYRELGRERKRREVFLARMGEVFEFFRTVFFFSFLKCPLNCIFLQ